MRATSAAGIRGIGTDPEVFEAFYREHLDAVHRFVARRVADPGLAADLTADVFLAAIESAHTYQPGRGSPQGWLYGVARNVVSSERRRAARALTANRRIAGRRLLDGCEIARMEDRIEAATEVRRAYEAMECLSDGERAVLELAALDGLAVSDIAHALGISSVTARVRLHRARRRMRELLAPAPPVAARGLASEVRS
ncbi:RNA polymerase sigma-70 factor, ECF subfamily [Amycolatopsis xylanica]|uniref:RNA polymerase sigma-70 factor, ECF subfamily n=1 Tax=Amycolatopsis xylanica TaxID=589385 RepID=A0A1H2VFZ5_9PSEU|nr:sigma-70 family RNA polymerase sigma factor [Amycolatopsis xylanica]SDW67212.1 RNA polymerase sigma-70 factor, ECF subfamily [Amycolatopsis xylanica]